MENEIELKIMLSATNIPLITHWLSQQTIIEQRKDFLGNTYYDSAEKYFAENKMGLRVRRQNQQYEMTLKMKGEIVGGLHIRPEYNLSIETPAIDFKRLVSHYHLQFDDAILNATLVPVFSTDFERQTWLIQYNQSQIEVALDQGEIKNIFGREAICEIEFELKQGNLADLFVLLQSMPKQDGMWLSSLSKAQRGYLVGNNEEIAKQIAQLTACDVHSLCAREQYQHLQQVIDFIRLTNDEALLQRYETLILEKEIKDLLSAEYLFKNLQTMRMLYQ